MIKLHIREVIENSGLSYDEIAFRMGITRSTLFGYVTGTNPRIGILDRIAIAIGCHIEDLYEFSHCTEDQKFRVTRKSRKAQRKEMRAYDDRQKMLNTQIEVYTPIILQEDATNNSEKSDEQNLLIEQRKNTLLSMLKSLNCPTEATFIVRSINRSQWGGKVMTKEVIKLLRDLPEILEPSPRFFILKSD